MPENIEVSLRQQTYGDDFTHRAATGARARRSNRFAGGIARETPASG